MNKFKNNINKFSFTKKDIMTFLVVTFFICFSWSNLFAAPGSETIAVLDDAGDKIYSILGATWLKVLFAVALCIEFGAVAFGASQGQGDTVKKLLPWIIGTAGCLGATSIVNFFFNGIEVEEVAIIINTIDCSSALYCI